MSTDLPLTTRFPLGPEITAGQRAFLDRHGFLHFPGVASSAEVSMLVEELRVIEESWLAERRRYVNGIPIFFGRPGRRFIQRFPFTSAFSERIRALVKDPRFEPIRRLVGEDARVGDLEKDGVVVNRYLNVPGSVHTRLGWHTDGLRDLFYGRMPQRMLNVGLHLDRCRREDGGLRLIPGSHLQGFWKMCFAKPYFVWHRADPREICIETEPGDLTIHDGRLWHRVARSGKTGDASIRHTMFVPYLTGPYEPKTEESPTPGYHVLGQIGRALRYWTPRRPSDVALLYREMSGGSRSELELRRG